MRHKTKGFDDERTERGWESQTHSTAWSVPQPLGEGDAKCCQRNATTCDDLFMGHDVINADKDIAGLK